MNELDQICKDGVDLESFDHNTAGFAFKSLSIGLKSYFETYIGMKYNIHMFAQGNTTTNSKDSNTTLDFFEKSATSILFFHHFSELIIKFLLRKIHPLLADVASNKAVTLKKLLRNEELSEEESLGLRSVEYKESLSRLIDLVKNGETGLPEDLEFFIEHRQMLEKLNTLRNRIWHRGKFILRYDSLDLFVCKYFFPFLEKVLELPDLQGKEYSWKYKGLKCGIDPLSELKIVSQRYNLKRTALLKELARAAYLNPFPETPGFPKLFEEENKNRSIAAANSIQSNVDRVEDCPVCGVNSLVVYDDVDGENYDPEDGNYDSAWRYTWQVECMCCSFEINNHLGNASDLGVAIPDYWESEEI